MTSQFISKAPKTRNGKSVNGNFHMLAGASNNRDKDWLDGRTDATLGYFNTLSLRLNWGEVEGAGSGTTSGAFDFSEARRMLMYCAERKIFLRIMLMWRKFTQTADITPADLVANYQYVAAGNGGPGTGYNSAIYNSTVRTRYENCLKALIDEFKDYEWFGGVVTNETSGLASSTGESYTLTKAETQLTALYQNLEGYVPYVTKEFIWNFLNGAGNNAAANTAFGNIFGSVTASSDVILSTPDILASGAPNYTALNDRVYPFIANSYDGTTHAINGFRRFIHNQFDSYASAENGGVDSHQLAVMAWGTSTGQLSIDGLVYTFDNSRTYTFDSPTTGNSVGDAVGVARTGWGVAYNANYAD